MSKIIIGLIMGLALGVSGTAIASTQFHNITLNADYSNGGSIKRFDDNRFQVTCWMQDNGYRGGLSCLPWSEVKPR